MVREAVPGVGRALRLVKIIGMADGRLSLGQITRAAELPKSTVFKYLYTLAEAGFVSRDDTTETYGIGPALSRMNRVDNHLLILSSCGRPLLVELSPKVGLTKPHLVNVAFSKGDHDRQPEL